ncbi:hypothetical protein ACFWAT_14240 [Streptomyces syringium]|uniref:hypothetical protein n=1 Tax=Streptomyces syringium TaxID=76729 RepID=UPI0036687B5E
MHVLVNLLERGGGRYSAVKDQKRACGQLVAAAILSSSVGRWSGGLMLEAGESWLEGATYNGIALAVGAAALLAALFALLYGRQATFPPKRRLTCRLASVSPLLTDSENALSGIQLSRNGQRLDDPYFAVVEVKNSGRFAISSEQYDRGRPLRLRLRSAIVEMVHVETSLRDSEFTSYECAGDVISLGPDLIREGQTLSFGVLVEGAPQLEANHHFVDTKVDVEAPGEPKKQFPIKTFVLMTVVNLLLSGAFYAFLIVKGEGRSEAGLDRCLQIEEQRRIVCADMPTSGHWSECISETGSRKEWSCREMDRLQPSRTPSEQPTG